MKNFIYLVQGQASQVKNYLHLADRISTDALFLTYDQPLETTAVNQTNLIYFPDSTWTEGRNKLFDTAISQSQDYQYYIFLDDDVEFIKGNWDLFEAEVLRYKPAIGIPIFPNTTNSPIHLSKVTNFPILRNLGLSYQNFLVSDPQLMAFHRSVINDRLILPYQTQFDSKSWWAASEIQDILIQTFYSYTAIQFNLIELSNELTERYKNVHEGGLGYKPLIRTWLKEQFSKAYQNRLRDVTYGNNCPKPLKYTLKLMISLWRTLVFSLLFQPNKDADYFRFPPHNVSKIFSESSVFR